MCPSATALEIVNREIETATAKMFLNILNIIISPVVVLRYLIETKKDSNVQKRK
tara:strand:+ start:173 stop:334 length:162 start_codon:yes stop_codon:yes gene_type:complete